MAYLQRASAALGCALLLSGVAHAETVTCTATAGLDKHEAATSSTGVERTGAYDVALSTGSQGGVMVAVSPKKDTTAGQATKVAAPIDKVLLRSPYKSEAIAQPKSFTPGAGPTEAVATFDAAAVRQLPRGDVNVIIFTADGERLCRIERKDRDRLVTSAR
jgi:hypothetical protein